MKKVNVITYSIFAIVIIILAIWTYVLNNKLQTSEQKYRDELYEKNQKLESQEDSITHVRRMYQDSLQQSRLERLYYEEVMDSLQVILTKIPNKYEEDRIIANHSADGTLVILSKY